ncbi:hypothetical protein SAMN02745111_01324 [Eubacterium uniforme]|uniref:Uncharacterized protein n=1 Tax=Eubacterium uniforme TaxID=39495 RepID=A0A1T4VNB9_9FIRM|nr:hypothetical protein [Eubacterium uniforme]SKA66482.1 hypothetical protein SAMN02745111_01324 [Eubacterium uniforme]
MKHFKRIIILSTVLVCLVSMTVSAKAGSYSSTYSMKGGVFSKKWIDPKSKCTVDVFPEIGTPGEDMAVIWANKVFFGWDGDYKWTSSTEPGTVTFKSSRRRKVWLRNFTGIRWEGKVTFSWD